MDIPVASRRKPSDPTFAELFTPKLVTILREGYGWSQFRADAVGWVDRSHRCAAVVDGDRHRLWFVPPTRVSIQPSSVVF